MKYPKTFHFKWSENLQNDDRMLPDESCFDGKELVYTEKLDGENTACSREGIHARSEDGYGKPWQSYMKKLYACFAHEIPKGITIFGENIYAVHSIKYDPIPTCFFVFGILDGETWLSWEDVLTTSKLLGLDTVPEICRGPLREIELPKKSAFGPTIEGYVARNIASYEKDDFQKNTGKFVRKNHVQTTTHWTKTWEPAEFSEDPIERLFRNMKGAC